MTEDGDNKRALPPPLVSNRPGPSDWANKHGAVFDGDYITLRCNAWDGVTIAHPWSADTLTVGGSTEVFGEKKINKSTARGEGPSPLQPVPLRMDNGYSFCIRKVVFDHDKKAWVLPSWDEWKNRRPIATNEHVVLLVPNDPYKVLGTRNPGTYGNNGDYRCELVQFPLSTTAELLSRTLSHHLIRIASFGFWREDRNNVDFLNQSRCVWSFNSIGDSRGGLIYGGSPINIRNMWTAVKAQEIAIWDAIGGAQVSIIAFAINSTFKGGRNLTLAKGSNGRTVKLALTNKNTDDKAGWIIDSWHGNRYPVQRAMIPNTAPPQVPDDEPEPSEPIRVITVPDLTEQIQRPPPIKPALTYDPSTGTNTHSGLQKGSQGQNPETLLDTISKAFFNKRWDQITYFQQLTIGGLMAAGIIVVTNGAVTSVINRM